LDSLTEERNWKPLKAGPFMASLGPLLVSRGGEGSFMYALETGEEHANALGLVHGGVISSLLDQVISMVAWTAADREPVVTMQLDTRFLRATKPGARLEAHAQIRHMAGSTIFVDAEVSRDMEIVALATALMKISRRT
jgi:uncharacterized protein (TIGR00369 family)